MAKVMLIYLLGFLVFAGFALTFVRASVDDDGLYYYAFLRRLFGVDTPAFAFQFGSAFWSAPFWLASQLVALRGELGYYRAGEVGVTIAASAAVIVCTYLGWRILRELDLPRGATVLMLGVFGTPLWFYAVSSPSYKHAADTLYLTAAFFFLQRLLDVPRLRHAAAASCCLGLLLTTRYVNVAVLAGVVVALGARAHRRMLVQVVVLTGMVAALLYAVPALRGMPYHRPADLPFNTFQGMDGPAPAFNAAEATFAASGPVQIVREHVHLDLLAPYKMLFTLHRGLFVWTPLTAVALVGFVLLLRDEPRHRRFLGGLGVAALALLETHVLYGRNLWDGGGAYSARFLTALFPLYVIGLAEAIRDELTGPLQPAPSHVTHLLISDHTDSANGSATIRNACATTTRS